MLWFDSIEAHRTGKPQQGRNLLIRLVKDLEDTRSEYKGYSYVRTIRNILIGKEDAAIAPFFKGKPYYGQFETLTLERVEQMMDSLVSSYQLDVIRTEHGKLYCTRENACANECCVKVLDESYEDNKPVTDLKSLLQKDPDAWSHINEFRSALLDLYPNDKVKRNLIFHCVEEGIPKDLLNKESIDDLEVHALGTRLVTAVGCNQDTAIEIIHVWADALGVENDDSMAKAQIFYDLGQKYENEKDFDRAYECYVNAAECGFADAASFLASAFEKGYIGLEEDEDSASEWYLKAAELGDVASQCEIAKRYYYGIGIEEDEEQAKKWLQIADENYDEENEDCSQEMIDCAYYIWFNKKKNFNYLTLHSFTWACDDFEEGVDAFIDALDDGFLGNYSEIGNFLYHGGPSMPFINIKVRQSTEEAFQLYERFYNDYSKGRLELHFIEGVIEAFYNYGYLYIVRNIGNFDFETAIEPWKKAIVLAEKCDPDDVYEYLCWDRNYLYQIGQIFYEGAVPGGGNEDGILCEFEPDIGLAYRAFTQAKRHGHEKAQEYLDKIIIPVEDYYELPFN